MYVGNEAEVFIRLLTEALEVDRMIRDTRKTARCKASATRFKQLFLSDLDHATRSLQPMDLPHNSRAMKDQDLRFS